MAGPYRARAPRSQIDMLGAPAGFGQQASGLVPRYLQQPYTPPVVTPPLLAADFTALAAGAVSLAGYGLSFSRASSGHSVQSGTATVVTSGVGSNDVPRAGRALDADPVALVIEEARTNVVANSRDMTLAGWVGGTGTTTHPGAPAGPDGGATPSRVVNGALAYGNYNGSGGLPAGARAASLWVRSTGGAASQNQHQQYDLVTVTPSLYAIDGTWSRHASAITAAGVGGQFGPCTSQSLGAGAPGALDNLLDLVQVEAGAFATEAIVTAAIAVTRAGERLYYATGSALVSSGRVGLEVKCQPKGSSAQYGADMYLWSVDANNAAWIDAATGAVKVKVTGTTYTTPVAMTWAARDVLELWLEAGGGSLVTSVKYRLNGGAVTVLSTGSPPTQAAVVAAGAMDLLCSGTANQLTAWVRTLNLYSSGSRPSWA